MDVRQSIGGLTMNKCQEILSMLESRRSKGQGVAHFQTYLDAVGNPQTELICVHIAGTNGKGSTLNFLRSILQEAGYRVGTFSSPYLETHFDRIRINDQPISETDFLSYYESDHEIWFAYDLGSFEIDTAIAFAYFRDQHCDICIIEAGIGGRFDCTNVVTPLISVITNIGMDHMGQLGNTLEEIAWQKAGIIKAGVPLITMEQHPSCLAIIDTACQTQHSELLALSLPQHVQQHKDITQFQYKGIAYTCIGAKYQANNAICAIETAIYLRDHNHYTIKEMHMQSGIYHTLWKGRFETLIPQDPWVVVDGAHNEEGIMALVESAKDIPGVRFLFAALKDKDTHQMMEHLCSISQDITVTQFPFYRAKSAKELAETFPVKIVEDFQQAINTLLKDKEHPLIITGSLYFISQVRDYLHTITNKIETF